MDRVLQHGWGHADPDGVKNVTTSGTAAEVQCDAHGYYLVIASEDLYYRWKESGGTDATSSDSYLPAGVPLVMRAGKDNCYFSAIQKDTAGFVRLSKLVAQGD